MGLTADAMVIVRRFEGGSFARNAVFLENMELMKG